MQAEERLAREHSAAEAQASAARHAAGRGGRSRRAQDSLSDLLRGSLVSATIATPTTSEEDEGEVEVEGLSLPAGRRRRGGRGVGQGLKPSGVKDLTFGLMAEALTGKPPSFW